MVQTQFRSKLGLLVDRVKQGVGTFNDGNTARRFFKNPNITAQITGVNENIIHRFSVILPAISSGQKINTEKFGHHAKETAELFVTLYPWYYMPVTVHKILIHGEKIIQNAIVPIGQLSEEAQESHNKEFRKFRECKPRKWNRKFTNEDILHNLLITSEPLISSL